MGDSRLRELERRWQEAETPASWTAYLREQIRAGTGVVPAAEAFLEGCLDFAETLAPDWRALLIAHVAWGYLDLGQEEQALALAQAAEGETDSLVGCAALTRVAAVAARLGQGHARFNDALSHARACLENSDLMGPRHFVISFLGAVDDVGPEADAAIQASLLREFLEVIPLRLIVGFGEAIRELKRLGMGDRVGEIRTLLDPQVRVAQGLILENASLERQFIVTTLGALALVGRPEDAALALDMARDPDLLGPDSVTAFQRILGACDDPLQAAVDMRAALPLPIDQAWISVSFLEWAAADPGPSPACASEWLAEALATARRHPLAGARVEERALPLVRIFWPRARALDWLQRVGAQTIPSFFKPGLLAVTARSLADFGFRTGAVADLDRVVSALMDLCEEPEIGGILPHQVLRALDLCAESAGRVGAADLCDRIEALTTSIAEECGVGAALDAARVRMSIAVARVRSIRPWTAPAVRSNLALICCPPSEETALLGTELAGRARSLAPGIRAFVGGDAVELVQAGIPMAGPFDDQPRAAVDALGALCRDLVGLERSA